MSFVSPWSEGSSFLFQNQTLLNSISTRNENAMLPFSTMVVRICAYCSINFTQKPQLFFVLGEFVTTFGLSFITRVA